MSNAIERGFDRVACEAQGAMPLRRIGLRRPAFDALRVWSIPAAAMTGLAPCLPCVSLARIRSAGDRMDRRHFIGSAALAAGWSLVGGGVDAGAVATAASRSRVLPLPISPGDTVALVSPSSATDERLSLQLALEAMQALGFKVRTGAHYA